LRLCIREDLHAAVLKLPAIVEVLRFMRAGDDTTCLPLFVQIVGLLRLLADAPEFPNRFSVEEMAVLLVRPALMPRGRWLICFGHPIWRESAPFNSRFRAVLSSERVSWPVTSNWTA
jgi:hypothetical protein